MGQHPLSDGKGINMAKTIKETIVAPIRYYKSIGGGTRAVEEIGEYYESHNTRFFEVRLKSGESYLFDKLSCTWKVDPGAGVFIRDRENSRGIAVFNMDVFSHIVER